MSSDSFNSVEDCLKKYIPDAELAEVQRILYGQSKEYIVLLNNFYCA